MDPRDFQFNPLAAGGLDDEVDWSDPASFFGARGMPTPRTMTPDAVRKEARKYSVEIFSKYDRLSAVIARHEAMIQRRWTKKTRGQRLQVLLQAWPGMPASHRPDFEAMRKGTKDHDDFMWPSINQEDLSQPKPLLLFLNARGRHPPPDFAAADCEGLHIGIVSQTIMPVFLNEHVMLLHRATTADEYGKLISWDEHPDAFDWMHTRKQFLPGEGLLVLEMQARLMAFLVDLCHVLLHDIPTDALVSDAYPLQPEPQLKTGVDAASGFMSLAAMTAEAPYRVPAQLDLGRIESIVRARMLAAEDHVWSLREDPSYYVHQYLEIKDHRQEMIPDTNGRAHPVRHPLRERILIARIVGTIAVEAYITLESFSRLYALVRNVRLLQERYESEISPMADLPKDYLVAVLRLRHFLKQAAKGPLGMLKTTVSASPPLRKFFVRNPPTDVNSSKLSIMSREEVPTNKSEQNLLWLLKTLWEDDHTLFLMRLPDAVNELEHLLQTDSHADSLISAYVMSTIADLSIVAQCLGQLELYQPWAQNFEEAEVDHIEDFRSEHASWSKPWAEVMAALRDQNLIAAAKLGEPIPGRFTYPFGKKRTKETVEALRSAESNLDALWAKLDEVMESKKPNLNGSALQRLLSQPRILRRTAEWVEPALGQAAKAKAEGSGGLEYDVNALNRSLSNLFLEPPGAKSGRRLSSSTSRPPKTKKKTKGIPSQTEDVAAEDGSDDPISVPQPTFPVDARAFKVFRILFFNPEVTSSPGSVSWSDFLHAMVSTGFTVEKLYGSVWQFTPTRLDVERSIHFHEPHPSGKIPFEMARRHGRRLTRTYGWAGGMFVLNK